MSFEKKFLARVAGPKSLLILNVLFLLPVYLISNFSLAFCLEALEMIKGFQSSSSLQELGGLDISLGSMFEFQPDYRWFYIGFYILAAFGQVRFSYQMKKNFATVEQNQYGTNDFEGIRELKKQYRSIPEKDKEFKGNGGYPISHYKKQFLVDDSPVNNLLIGITRSGKGETQIFQLADIYSRANEKASLIFNDPKGELAAASYDTLKERGYDVHVLNLLNPDLSMSYNPLQLVIDAHKKGDHTTAQQLVNTVSFSLYYEANVKDPFWQNSAMSLFNAVALAITADSIKKGREEQINLYSVANFIADLGSKEDEHGNNELDKFFQRRPSTDPARMQYATSNFAKGNTRSGIFSVAMSKLNTFTLTENARMTTKNSLNLESVGFGDKPVAIFMVTPDYDKSNHAIASVFVRQLYFVLAKKASTSEGNKCKREVVFVLDEFGNMPAIEGMETIITVCLGRGIKFNLVVQSYSQLASQYGSDASKIISGNCGNHIYILTNDHGTAEQFSKLIGPKTITDVSRSGKFFSFEKSESESAKERPLLTPNELMRLKLEETVVVRVSKREDLKRRKIISKPIYNTGKLSLKSRWRYLSDKFDTDGSIYDLPLVGIHKNVNLEDVVFGSRTEKDKYSKLVDELTPVQIGQITKYLLDTLPEDDFDIFDENKKDISFLQFRAFLTYVYHELSPVTRKRIKFLIKPFFEEYEWEEWEASMEEKEELTKIQYNEANFSIGSADDDQVINWDLEENEEDSIGDVFSEIQQNISDEEQEDFVVYSGQSEEE